MYHHIDGALVALNPTRAVVEAGGVGYDLSIPFSTYTAVKVAAGPDTAGPDAAVRRPGRVHLLLHFLVRQDVQRLFGFATEPERDLFRALIEVSGVGPSIALAILSSYSVEEFNRIVASEDAEALRRIKGIGRKTAERLLIDLRDRLGKPLAARRGGSAGARPRSGASAGASAAWMVEEAVRALIELGYSAAEAEKRVGDAAATLSESAAAAPTIEAILTEVLRRK